MLRRFEFPYGCNLHWWAGDKQRCSMSGIHWPNCLCHNGAVVFSWFL